jgi:tRNA (guanine-N7-)-methyltransferase
MLPVSDSTQPPDPRVRPYSDAPRLPEGENVDPRTLVESHGRPVELELGPGRGGFVFERLAHDANVALIGLEIRRKWATIVDTKLNSLGLGRRARVFAEDGKNALPRFPAASVSAVFVHFPDPWWKKRHTKRLLLGDALLDHLVRVLVPGGEIFVQSDVEERIDRYQALLDAHTALEPFSGTPRIAENPFGARSPREHRAIADGLPIYRLHYRRR